jgi:hypothetical protein
MSQENQAEYAMELKLRAVQRGKRKGGGGVGSTQAAVRLEKIATRSWARSDWGGGAGSVPFAIQPIPARMVVVVHRIQHLSSGGIQGPWIDEVEKDVAFHGHIDARGNRYLGASSL